MTRNITDWLQVNAAENAGLVMAYLDLGPLDVSMRLYPDEAREMASRLIEAAKQVEDAAAPAQPPTREELFTDG